MVTYEWLPALLIPIPPAMDSLVSHFEVNPAHPMSPKFKIHNFNQLFNNELKVIGDLCN